MTCERCNKPKVFPAQYEHPYCVKCVLELLKEAEVEVYNDQDR